MKYAELISKMTLRVKRLNLFRHRFLAPGRK